MNIQIKHIQEPDELDELIGKTIQINQYNITFDQEYIDKLKKSLNEPHALHLIASDTDTKEFAGYIASSEKRNPGYLYIYELFIDQNYQRQGIGTELINEAIVHAKDRMLKGIIVQTEYVNIPAQKIYAKLGFKLIKSESWNEGITFQLDFN